jgi:hypothetical protein
MIYGNVEDQLAARAYRRSSLKGALVSDVIAILVLAILVCVILAAHGQSQSVVVVSH